MSPETFVKWFCHKVDLRQRLVFSKGVSFVSSHDNAMLHLKAVIVSMAREFEASASGWPGLQFPVKRHLSQIERRLVLIRNYGLVMWMLFLP
jgi:hypothetical protein